MIGLLDVNVLIALFDAEHAHHDLAHEWFRTHRRRGWATCPITENGLIRIVANPAYPGSKTTIADAFARLLRFRDSGDHTFWEDSVSILGTISAHIGGHQRLTDVYLLALAFAKKGRLVTFDRRIPLSAIHGARAQHIEVIRG